MSVKVFRATCHDGVLQIHERTGDLVPGKGVALNEGVPGVWDSGWVHPPLCHTPLDALEQFVEEQKTHFKSFNEAAAVTMDAIDLAREEIRRLKETSESPEETGEELIKASAKPKKTKRAGGGE